MPRDVAEGNNVTLRKRDRDRKAYKYIKKETEKKGKEKTH